MRYGIAGAALALAGALAGCATTVDWGGPLGHYRYNYDSRPVTYSAPAPVTYTAPTVSYSPTPTVTSGTAPTVVYESRASYGDPVVVYDNRSAQLYHDHGQ